MARPVINGTHVVPKEVSALKPKNIPCDIKVVVTESKTCGSRKHYYVYESARTGSGKVIGKIEGGQFCPNSRGRELLGEKAAIPDANEKEATGRDSKDSMHNLSSKELETVKEAAINLNVDITDIVLDLLC